MDRTFNLETFLRPAMDLFSSGTGVFVLLGLGLVLCLSFVGRLRWFVLGFTLYASSLTFYYSSWFNTRFLPPVQQLVENGRPLTLTLLGILLIVSFTTGGRASMRELISYGPLAYFLFQLLFCFRIAAGGLLARAATSVITDLLIFFVLSVGLSRWMRTHRDVAYAAWALATAGICFCVVTTIHLLLTPQNIIQASRLISTSGTATLASELIAVTLVPICYFVAQPDRRKWQRVVLGCIAGLQIVFLIWTGTRTGMLMAIVGLLLLFRLKLGRMFVAGLVVTFFVWLGLQVFGDALIGAGRLLSTEDTRSGTWSFALSQFLANPVFGVIETDVQAVENSYLSVAARMGVIGILAFGVVMICVISGLRQLQQARRFLGPQAPLADLCIAGIVSLAIGGVLEGYLLGTVNIQMYALFIYLSMMCTLLDPTKADENFELTLDDLQGMPEEYSVPAYI